MSSTDLVATVEVRGSTGSVELHDLTSRRGAVAPGRQHEREPVSRACAPHLFPDGKNLLAPARMVPIPDTPASAPAHSVRTWAAH
eukprot:2053707-Rhodomonas_salina.1